jgi:hypothetical protein
MVVEYSSAGEGSAHFEEVSYAIRSKTGSRRWSEKPEKGVVVKE